LTDGELAAGPLPAARHPKEGVMAKSKKSKKNKKSKKKGK
jgi:hypothetical protein